MIPQNAPFLCAPAPYLPCLLLSMPRSYRRAHVVYAAVSSLPFILECDMWVFCLICGARVDVGYVSRLFINASSLGGIYDMSAAIQTSYFPQFAQRLQWNQCMHEYPARVMRSRRQSVYMMIFHSYIVKHLTLISSVSCWSRCCLPFQTVGDSVKETTLRSRVALVDFKIS